MNEIDILEQQAIDSAIALQWKSAIIINERLLDLDSENIGACLRLGFAHLQMKNLKQAKKYYSKAAKIQPKNRVALENLERITILEDKGMSQPSKEQTSLNPSLFLDVPGMTKTVTLVNVGQKNHIAELDLGQTIVLKAKKRKVEVRTSNDIYIGTLPDDLSKRLIYFIKAKSAYVGYIKEAEPNKVTIFIREEKKGKKVAHFLSFPHNIQSNLNHMNNDDDATTDHEEEEVNDENELEKLANDLTTPEDKEHLVDIHSDDDEEVEE
ncbi:MAG: tetratricopeptide repeat protein [bacterium]|nr:tetratricopeptide repeat protein [bacterium]